MPLDGRYIWQLGSYRDEYHVRELADGTVVWVGEHAPALAEPLVQPQFTNVFRGHRTRIGIRGELVDVPKGQTRNVFKNILVGIGSGDPAPFINFALSGIGRRQLRRDGSHVASAERREYLSGFVEPAPSFLTGDYLTGVWRCDDGGLYYVHQSGLRVFWFAEHPAPTGWAHVFFGRLGGTTLSGQWFDVPKGSTEGSGTLDLTISSPARLDRDRMTGGFAGSTWDKLL